MTPFGAAMLLGATATLAEIVQAGATIAAVGFVGWVWRRGLPLPIRAASLVSATLVAVPLALFYDLVLAGIVSAWLLRGEAEYCLPEWGKAAIAVLYVLSLNPRGIAAHLHFPAGPLTAVALATIVATIAFRGRRTVKRVYAWRAGSATTTRCSRPSISLHFNDPTYRSGVSRRHGIAVVWSSADPAIRGIRTPAAN